MSSPFESVAPNIFSGMRPRSNPRGWTSVFSFLLLFLLLICKIRHKGKTRRNGFALSVVQVYILVFDREWRSSSLSWRPIRARASFSDYCCCSAFAVWPRTLRWARRSRGFPSAPKCSPNLTNKKIFKTFFDVKQTHTHTHRARIHRETYSAKPFHLSKYSTLPKWILLSTILSTKYCSLSIVFCCCLLFFLDSMTGTRTHTRTHTDGSELSVYS